MDEELKAIQDDLDNVLERLAKYMNLQEDQPPSKNKASEDIEDAASVVLLYSQEEDRFKSLSLIVEIFKASKNDHAVKKAKLIEMHGKWLGRVIACFESLSNHLFIPNSDELNLLRVAANDFMEGRSKWVGQSLGLPLARPRKTSENEAAKPPLITDGYVDSKAMLKMIGAMDVYYAHEGKKTPIDDGIFELIAKRWNLKPGTLKDFYYNNDRMKKYKNFNNLLKEIRSSK